MVNFLFLLVSLIVAFTLLFFRVFHRALKVGLGREIRFLMRGGGRGGVGNLGEIFFIGWWESEEE